MRMKSKRVFFSVAEVVLLDLTVNGSGKEVVDGTSAHVVADGGVHLLEKFLGKRGGTFSVSDSCKSKELSQGEVAREHSHDVEKAGLRVGVAEVLDSVRCEQWADS